MKAVAGISNRHRAGVFFLAAAIGLALFFEEDAHARRGRAFRRGGVRVVQAQRPVAVRRQFVRRGVGNRFVNVPANNNANNLNFDVGGLNDLALASAGLGFPFGVRGFNQFGFNGFNNGFNAFNDQIAVLNDGGGFGFNRFNAFGSGLNSNPVLDLGRSISGLPAGFTPLIGADGFVVQNVFQSPQGLVEALPGAFANGQIVNAGQIQGLIRGPNGQIFAGQNRSLNQSTLGAVQVLNGLGPGLDTFGSPIQSAASRAPAEVGQGRPLAQ